MWNLKMKRICSQKYKEPNTNGMMVEIENEMNHKDLSNLLNNVHLERNLHIKDLSDKSTDVVQINSK